MLLEAIEHISAPFQSRETHQIEHSMEDGSGGQEPRPRSFDPHPRNVGSVERGGYHRWVAKEGEAFGPGFRASASVAGIIRPTVTSVISGRQWFSILFLFF